MENLRPFRNLDLASRPGGDNAVAAEDDDGILDVGEGIPEARDIEKGGPFEDQGARSARSLRADRPRKHQEQPESWQGPQGTSNRQRAHLGSFRLVMAAAHPPPGSPTARGR